MRSESSDQWNGKKINIGFALSTWSSLSGFHWGHYYHKHSCLLFSLSLSVTVMLMSKKISTWVLYISTLWSWYCCQSHSHCHDLGPIKMRLKAKWKIFSWCVPFLFMHADQTIIVTRSPFLKKRWIYNLPNWMSLA